MPIDIYIVTSISVGMPLWPMVRFVSSAIFYCRQTMPCMRFMQWTLKRAFYMYAVLGFSTQYVMQAGHILHIGRWGPVAPFDCMWGLDNGYRIYSCKLSSWSGGRSPSRKSDSANCGLLSALCILYIHCSILESKFWNLRDKIHKSTVKSPIPKSKQPCVKMMCITYKQ